MAHYRLKNADFEIKNVKMKENCLTASVNGENIEINIIENDPVFIEMDGVLHPLYATKDEKNNIYIQFQGKNFKLEHIAKEGIEIEDGVLSGKIQSPMPGKILELKVKQGELVEKDQVILLMESMKLQVEIKAPFNGVVKTLNCEVNQMVDSGELLVEIVEE